MEHTSSVSRLIVKARRNQRPPWSQEFLAAETTRLGSRSTRNQIARLEHSPPAKHNADLLAASARALGISHETVADALREDYLWVAAAAALGEPLAATSARTPEQSDGGPATTPSIADPIHRLDALASMLRESEIPTVLVAFQEDGPHSMIVNQATYDLFGWSPDEPPAKFEWLAPRDRPESVREKLTGEVQADPVGGGTTVRFMRKDGTRFDAELRWCMVSRGDTLIGGVLEMIEQGIPARASSLTEATLSKLRAPSA